MTGLLFLIYQTIEFATAFCCHSSSLFLFIAYCNGLQEDTSGLFREESKTLFRVYCIYVWIYENGTKELKSRPKLAFFLARIKRKVSAFFLPLPVYLPFIGLLSLFCARLLGLKKA